MATILPRDAGLDAAELVALTPVREAVTLGTLLRHLRRRWYVPALASLAGLTIAVLYLQFATYLYTATLVVTPSRVQRPELPGNLSSIASITGINLQNGGSGRDFFLYVKGLQSRDVATRFARDERLVKRIFWKRVDPATGAWKPPGLLARTLDSGRTLIRMPVRRPLAPDAADLEIWLGKNLRIATDRKTDITTLALDHPDPAFAVRLLGALHDATDESLRQSALRKTTASINYLQDKLRVAQIAEYREAIARILLEQERTRMLAASGAPFAAEPFGGVSASAEPTSPDIAVVLAIGLLGPALLAAGLLLATRRPRMADVW